jgi:hypothetical protein
MSSPFLLTLLHHYLEICPRLFAGTRPNIAKLSATRNSPTSKQVFAISGMFPFVIPCHPCYRACNSLYSSLLSLVEMLTLQGDCVFTKRWRVKAEAETTQTYVTECNVVPWKLMIHSEIWEKNGISTFEGNTGYRLLWQNALTTHKEHLNFVQYWKFSDNLWLTLNINRNETLSVFFLLNLYCLNHVRRLWYTPNHVRLLHFQNTWLLHVPLALY